MKHLHQSINITTVLYYQKEIKQSTSSTNTDGAASNMSIYSTNTDATAGNMRIIQHAKILNEMIMPRAKVLQNLRKH